MTNQPNPARVAAAIVRAQMKRRPNPRGDETFDHAALQPTLSDLRQNGLDALPNHRARLASYRDRLEMLDPDTFTRTGALAFWLNLYNAGEDLDTPGIDAACTDGVGACASEGTTTCDAEAGVLRCAASPVAPGALLEASPARSSASGRRGW